MQQTATPVLEAFNFKLVPAFKPEQLLEQVRSSMARGLPEVRQCKPHEHVLSVAAGGPSLQDTYRELGNYVAAVNGSLSWLLDHDVIPNLCGVCDPSPHMLDIVEADKRVTYFVASSVHPSVFDKLLSAGCDVVLWHAAPIDGMEALLDELYKGKDSGWLEIGGGSTMGMRWINLGYQCGFRSFHVHGLDSSFRIDPVRGRASHAYPDHQDHKDWVKFDGFDTKPNFIGQVADFIGLMERFTHPDIEPVEIKLYGEGLLQKRFAAWQEANLGWHTGGPKPALLTDGFEWPSGDERGMSTQLIDVKSMPGFMEHVPGREVVVQAGGNVGVYPAHLARYFNRVYTFEPDENNFACLSRNITLNKGKIEAFHAALGSHSGTVSTIQHKPGDAGCIMVSEVEDGAVPMRTIDDLDLDACDLIWLDIEGYEEKALEGAERTIEKYRPAVIVEVNMTPQLHGLEIGGAVRWLEDRGYQRKVNIHNDILYLP